MCKELREYLDSDGVVGKRLAEKAGLTAAFLSQIASGVRPVPPIRCAAIELATGLVVRRWHMRPDDWHQIWPELVNDPAAPKPQRALL